MLKQYNNMWSKKTTLFLKWKWCMSDKKNENPIKCKKLYDEYLKACKEQNNNKIP
jgi:hypothetical protein